MNSGHMQERTKRIYPLMVFMLVIVLLTPSVISLVSLINEDHISFVLFENTDENEEKNEDAESNDKNEQKQSQEFILNSNGWGSNGISFVPKGLNQRCLTPLMDVLTPPPDMNVKFYSTRSPLT